MNPQTLSTEHRRLTRRFFLGLGAAGLAGLRASKLWGGDQAALDRAIADLVARYLTPAEDFGTVERGNPLPYTLPEEKRRQVGLEPETWQLEVLADPSSNSKLDNPLSRADGTALTWQRLMQLAQRHAVSFLKVMTCNNGGAPLGIGLWEHWYLHIYADLREGMCFLSCCSLRRS